MGTNARSSFAVLLKGHRLARGLTQEVLAEAAGLSREAITLLERGARRSPRRDTVALLARALGLSGDERARLLAAAAAARVAAEPPRASNPAAPLPVRLTSFIGREPEIAEVRALVVAKRLVTLTGAGGIGKTSLALAVVERAQAEFADGVALVDLAALNDADLVPHAVAGVVGLRERPDELILSTLGRAMRTAERLLVLDNCEHLAPSCAQLAEALLQACPHLRILATSREPLRIGGEVIWRVPPLTLPGDGAQPLGALAKSDAVRLFAERAEAIRPGFALTEANAAAVAEICWRLDGIPLAIELAAARVSALPVEQIARHLNDRFRLLTTGSRTALPRHQTLRGLFDWSHDLLSENERVLFRRLAVFAGGWTLEAAEAVCSEEGSRFWVLGASPPATPESDTATQNQPPETEHLEPRTQNLPGVLDSLLGLVDKSLALVEERAGEAYYRLLETLREYARDKLNESGETSAARAAHAAYFAGWAGGPAPQPIEEIMERDVALPLASVVGEADNLRAALGYFLEREEAEAGLGLAARIYHLWFLHGPREEGRAWLRRLLALAVPAPSPSRAAALFAAGWLAQHQGDPAEANAAYTETMMLVRAREDRSGQALVRAQLASLDGLPASARAELVESVRLARETDAPAVLLANLAHVVFWAVARGDLTEAREALAEGRAVLPRFPARGFQWDWLAGDLALAEGRFEQAARDYRTALTNRKAAGDSTGVSFSVLRLAEVAAAARDGDRAVRLLGGAEGVALVLGGQLTVEALQQAQQVRVEAAARELLGDEAFAALRAEGRRLSVEEVVRLALADR